MSLSGKSDMEEVVAVELTAPVSQETKEEEEQSDLDQSEVESDFIPTILSDIIEEASSEGGSEQAADKPADKPKKCQEQEFDWQTKLAEFSMKELKEKQDFDVFLLVELSTLYTDYIDILLNYVRSKKNIPVIIISIEDIIRNAEQSERCNEGMTQGLLSYIYGLVLKQAVWYLNSGSPVPTTLIVCLIKVAILRYFKLNETKREKVYFVITKMFNPVVVEELSRYDICISSIFEVASTEDGFQQKYGMPSNQHNFWGLDTTSRDELKRGLLLIHLGIEYIRHIDSYHKCYTLKEVIRMFWLVVYKKLEGRLFDETIYHNIIHSRLCAPAIVDDFNEFAMKTGEQLYSSILSTILNIEDMKKIHRSYKSQLKVGRDIDDTKKAVVSKSKIYQKFVQDAPQEDVTFIRLMETLLEEEGIKMKTKQPKGTVYGLIETCIRQFAPINIEDVVAGNPDFKISLGGTAGLPNQTDKLFTFYKTVTEKRLNYVMNACELNNLSYKMPRTQKVRRTPNQLKFAMFHDNDDITVSKVTGLTEEVERVEMGLIEVENENRWSYYENTRMLDYCGYENLDMQELGESLQRAKEDYERVAYIKSKYNDNFLVRCYNEVDYFGISVRNFNESLITPVCIRDFCKYVIHEGAVKEFFDKNEDKPLVLPQPMYMFDNTPNRIQLIGRTITFHSLDGYKITVNTARLIDDPITVRLGISIIDWVKFSMNYNFSEIDNVPFSFKFTRPDGTIITFSKPSIPQTGSTVLFQESCKLGAAKTDDETQSPRQFHCQKMRKFDPTDVNLSLPPFNNQIIFKPPSSQRVTEVQNPVRLSDVDRIVKRIKKARKAALPEIKVCSSKLHKFKYMVATKSIIKIKAEGKTVRIRTKPSHYRLKKLAITKGVPLPTKPIDPKYPYDINVTLPNSLNIKSYATSTSVLPNIKQVYSKKNRPTNEAIKNEAFRVYSGSGFFAKHKTNGTVLLYYANGDIVEVKPAYVMCTGTFKYKANLSESKPKKSKRVLQRRWKHMIGKGSESRYYRPKQYWKAKIRQLSSTLLKHVCYTDESGQAFSLSDKMSLSLTNRQFYKVAHDNTKGIYAVLDDGTQRITMDDGSRVIVFPDQTRITTSVYIADEPVYAQQADVPTSRRYETCNDGFMLVNKVTMFEHPDYATVIYDHPGEMVKVVLPDDATITLANIDHSFLQFGSNITVNMNKKLLSISSQLCKECSEQSVTTLRLENLYSRKADLLPINDLLLKSVDTNKKVFCVNHDASCFRNTQFKNLATDRGDCTFHVKEHQRLFIVDKSLKGISLITCNAYNDLCKRAFPDPYTEIGYAKCGDALMLRTVNYQYPPFQVLLPGIELQFTYNVYTDQIEIDEYQSYVANVLTRNIFMLPRLIDRHGSSLDLSRLLFHTKSTLLHLLKRCIDLTSPEYIPPHEMAKLEGSAYNSSHFYYYWINNINLEILSRFPYYSQVFDILHITQQETFDSRVPSTHQLFDEHHMGTCTCGRKCCLDPEQIPRALVFNPFVKRPEPSPPYRDRPQGNFLTVDYKSIVVDYSKAKSRFEDYVTSKNFLAGKHSAIYDALLKTVVKLAIRCINNTPHRQEECKRLKMRVVIKILNKFSQLRISYSKIREHIDYMERLTEYENFDINKLYALIFREEEQRRGGGPSHSGPSRRH